jgi:integrase/recombinase XerD
MPAIPPNKGKRYPAEPLTPAEVQLLLDGCSRKAPTGIRNRAMLTLLYRSGLRVSEILAIKPSDVGLAKHSIRLLDTKSGEAQTRYFHPTAEDALQRWSDTRKSLGIPAARCKCKIVDGQRVTDQECRAHLFCTLDGGPVSDDYVRNMLRRLAAKAGITKRVHPHGLRHTFAVELEATGMPVTRISELLGHSSIAVTARYLNHLTNAQAGAALEQVELPHLDA